MSRYRGAYVAAGPCTGGPQPGARALMSWFLGAYGPRGGLNGGIYNCRPIAGTAEPSTHGEGRADDLMTGGTDWGRSLAQWLVDYSADLGVQLVIHDGRYWSCLHPDAGWLPYHGINPHREHIHAELTWDAARNLTVGRIEQVVAGTAEPFPVGVTVSVGTGADVYAFCRKQYGTALGINTLRRLNPGFDNWLRWLPDLTGVGYKTPILTRGRPVRT